MDTEVGSDHMLCRRCLPWTFIFDIIVVDLKRCNIFFDRWGPTMNKEIEENLFVLHRTVGFPLLKIHYILLPANSGYPFILSANCSLRIRYIM